MSSELDTANQSSPEEFNGPGQLPTCESTGCDEIADRCATGAWASIALCPEHQPDPGPNNVNCRIKHDNSKFREAKHE